MPSDNPTCVTCRWWDEHSIDDDDIRLGECHRYPPSLEYLGNKVGPTVSEGDWCGEHAPRAAESARQDTPDAPR